jgi:hypothetical protein
MIIKIIKILVNIIKIYSLNTFKRSRQSYLITKQNWTSILNTNTKKQIKKNNLKKVKKLDWTHHVKFEI